MSTIYSVYEELISTTTAADYDGTKINETIYSLDEAPVLTERATIKALILAVLAGTSFLANSATLLSIAISRKSNKSSSSSSSTLYTLLFQLAVADLLVSVWCLSGEAAWTYTVEWKGGEILCKIFKFSQVFSLYLSTSTMILIGFDRLLAIRRPINHRSCIRPIGIAWITSALLASPQLAVFRVLEGPFREPFYQCVTYGFYTEEWQEQLYSIFSLLTMFILPLITLISCYVCIFYTIAKEKERSVLSQRRESGRRNTTNSSNKNLLNGSSSRPLHHRSNNKEPNNSSAASSAMDHHRQDIFQRAKMKSLRISVIIVTAFVICWAPYYFMMITFIFLKPDEKLGEEMQSAIFFFGMSNSLINPLIYGAFHLCSRPDRRAGSAQHQQQIMRFHPGSPSFFFSRMRTNNNRGLRMIADDFHHHPAGHHQNNSLIIPGTMMQMDLADTSSRSSSIVSQQQRCPRLSPASVTTCV